MGKDQNRLEYLNIARGFAIFFVVLAHTFVPEIRGANAVVMTAFFWMTTFTIQSFMMISGYLFERGYPKYRAKGNRAFYLGKLQSIMFPYFTMSVLSYAGIGLAFLLPSLGKVLQSGGYAAVGLRHAIYQIMTYEGHMINHLWFLPTLFLIFVMSYLTGSFFAGVPGLLISIAASILPYYFAMPVLVYRVCAMLVFFNIGRRMTFVDAFSQKRMLAPMLVIFIGLFAVQRTGILDGIALLEAIITLIIGVAGSMTFFAISRMIAGRAIGRCVSWLGDNAFVIYLLHQPFIVSGVSGILLMFTPLPHLVICGITLVSGIFIPFFVNKYIISRVRVLRGLLLGDFTVKTKQETLRNG